MCGAATAGGAFQVAMALWASAVKCSPLKRKNTHMMSPFCSMCPIQLTVADVPIASS